MNSKLIKIIAGLLALAASASAQELFYYYNGQKVPLAADPDSVMIREDSSISSGAGVSGGSSVQAKSQAAARLAAKIGVDRSDVSFKSLKGWARAKWSAAAKGRAKSVTIPNEVAFVAPILRSASNLEIYPTNEILVRYKEGKDPVTVFKSLKLPGLSSQSQIGQSGIWKVSTNLRNGYQVIELANQLHQAADIEFAEPSFITEEKVDAIPTDPLFGQAWGLKNTGQSSGLSGFDMGATSAWDLTMGGGNVVVAIFECGIENSHPDLNVIAGQDFTDEPVAGGAVRANGDEGADNHGTWVAGCIAAKANNGIGATGVAPGVKVISMRTGIPTGGLSFSSSNAWRIAALDWCIANGVRLTNHSYTTSPSSSLDSAFQRARQAGMIHFASTGNDNASTIGYPASSPYVVAVGAADRNGRRASFSNYGSGIALLAPGVEVVTTDRVGSKGSNPSNYSLEDGTSFACPYATGVAALLVSRYPTLTPAQIEQRLVESCTDMGPAGYDTQHGYGLINAYRALGGGTTPPATTDDHGNTFATARQVSVPSTTAGQLETNSDSDVFKFTVSTPTTFTVKSTGNVDTYGHLYNGSGQEIDSNDDANGSRNFAFSGQFSAGTYYVEVHSYDRASSGSYNFVIEASGSTPPPTNTDDHGNTIATARQVSVPSTTAGQLETNSDSDVFKFTVSTATTLTVKSTGNVDTYGHLYNGSGQEIDSNDDANGSRNFAFTGEFSAGTYYVEVHSYERASSGAYNLVIEANVTTPPPGGADDYGNTIPTAAQISVPSATTGVIEVNSDSDFFKFTPSATGSLTIRTSGSMATTGRLYDSAGNLIRQSTYPDPHSSNRNFSLVQQVATGSVYYIEVQSLDRASTGAYTLHLESQSTPPSSLANLIPWPASGWQDKIIVAISAGSRTDSTAMTPTDSLLVSWAVTNNGQAAAGTFRTELYVDGTLRQAWITGSLASGSTTVLVDYPLGSLSTGSHTLRIKTDSENAVSEGNEADNEYVKILVIGSGAAPTFTLAPASVNVSAAGASGTFSVQTQSTSTWTARSNVSWIEVISPANSSTGPGTVSYSAHAYSGSTPRTGAITVGSVTFTLTQSGKTGTSPPPKSDVPVVDEIELPVVSIGQTIDLTLAASNDPTRFTANGLPPGVRLEAQTGRLTGRPTAAKKVSGSVAPYQVRITAANAAGTSAPVILEWMVEPLDPNLAGTFEGLIAPNAVLNGAPNATEGFGGLIRIATTLSGGFSGSIKLGSASHAVRGSLLITDYGAEPSIEAVIARRAPLAPLMLSLRLNAETGTLEGTLSDEAEVADIYALRAEPNAGLAGLYNTTLTGMSDDPTVSPQGNGFVTVQVSPRGQVNLRGRLADGTTLTGGSVLTLGGQIHLFQMLYSSTGSIMGNPVVDGSNAYGSFNWLKNPQTRATRSYAGGFSGSLELVGGRYAAPAAGEMPMDLPSELTLELNSGGLPEDLSQPFSLNARAAVVMPANENAIKLTLNKTSGLYTGSFKVADPDKAGKWLQASLSGVLVPGLGDASGAGYFLLPQAGGSSSAILSGQALIR